MVNDNKIKSYIANNLKKGYSLEQIEKALISAGYDPTVVKEASSLYKKRPVVEEKPPVVEKKVMFNKRLLLLVGGLIVLVVVVLFFLFFYKPSVEEVGPIEEPEEPIPEEPIPEESITEEPEMPFPPDFKLTFDEDLQTCVAEASENTSNVCWAYTKEDITLCDKAKMKEECRTDYQLFKAMVSQSCEGISDATSQSRILCDCLVSGNRAQCEKVDFEYEAETPEDENIFYTGITTRDSSGCSGMSQKESREMCLYLVHITLALMNSDTGECEKLPGLGEEIEHQIKFCKALVSKDPLLCVQEEEIISECKKDAVARLSQDEFFSAQVCELIEDEEGKNLCLDLIQE